MNEKPKTRAERSIDWQNRYVAPVLLVIGLIGVAAVWAVGGVAWWIALAVLSFGTYALVKVIQRNRE